MSAHDQEFLISTLGWFPFVDKLSSVKQSSGTEISALRMSICECRFKEEKEAQ